MSARSLGLFLIALWTAGCGPADPRDPQAALDAAAPGDVVELSSGTFVGALLVPAGVVLRGDCAGETLLTVDSTDPAVTLADDAGLECVRVVPQGGFGVVANTAGGEVTVRDVRVDVGTGVGVGLGALARARLENIVVAGTVRVENASSFTEAVSPTNSPLAGVVAIDVADLSMSELSVNGMAYAGALLVDSETEWTDGAVAETLGAGIVQQGGVLTIVNVNVDDVLQGASAVPGYGMVSIEGTLVSTNVEVNRTEGVGVLQAGGVGEHQNLYVTYNTLGGLWAQNATTLEITDGEAWGNNLAGIFVDDVAELRLSGLVIKETAAVPWPTSDSISSVGDGLHIINPDSLALTDLEFRDNDRVSLFLQADVALSAYSAENITITGTGEALGAVAQGVEPDSWDLNISRDAVTAANDAANVDTLEVLEAVSPTNYPAPAQNVPDTLEVFGAVSPTN